MVMVEELWKRLKRELKKMCIRDSDCTDCGKIDIKYFTLRTPIAADTYPTGGCRIKIIKNISGNDTIVRLYNYSEDGRYPTSPSSGVLTYMPRYGSIISKAYQPEQPLDFNGNSLCRLWG